MAISGAANRQSIPSFTWTCRAGFLAFAVVCAAVLAGCNPQALSMLLMPWVDNNEQPKWKIAESKKEVTVAIVAWFGNTSLETRPELMPADGELADQLAKMLQLRHKGNKEKVKIMPTAQVRAAQSKGFGGTVLPGEVGAKVKADKVIALEIRSLSLRLPGSSRVQSLYQGNIAIDVKLYDMERTEARLIHPDTYTFAFPKDAPSTAEFANVDQFRQVFLSHVVRDLSRWFAAYPHDETMHSMDSD